jgi:hypothetical protein
MPIEPVWYAALTLFLSAIARGAPAGVLCAVTAFAALSQACRALVPGAGPDLAAFVANAGACALTLLILEKLTCAESSAP